MTVASQRPVLGRRDFLLGAVAAGGAVGAAPAHALPFLRRLQEAPAEPRGLLMVHQRTGEIFNEVYFDGRAYLQEPLERFAHFARDLHTGETGEMDPALLDLAAALQVVASPEEPLILTHGFRSSSRNVRGGAANSHHLHGQALDITHQRLGARALHGHAASLNRGGLGRYARFIHIDTGPTRRW